MPKPGSIVSIFGWIRRRRWRKSRDGRAVHRRLNRYEYENALRDLLHIPWAQVKDKLPLDGERHGFNKSGEALDVSFVQIERYLGAADYAMRQAMGAAFAPEKVMPAALFLVSEDAPTNAIVGAGAGVFQAAYVTLTPGVALHGDELSPEGVAAHWAQITDRAGEIVPQSGAEQAMLIMKTLQGGA